MELIQLDKLRETLELYAKDVRNLYQDKLIESNRIAAGDLLNSVEYKVDVNGSQYEVTLTLADYWKYVEFGTKPHFPPTQALIDWIKIKPVIPRPDANGNIPTPKQLAYLIGRKIATKGTKGSGDLQSALDELNSQYADKLAIALHEDCEGLMKVVISDFQGIIPE